MEDPESGYPYITKPAALWTDVSREWDNDEEVFTCAIRP